MLSPLFCIKRRCVAALGVFSALPLVVAHAADWEVVRSITIAETYTDNVRLASDAEGKQSDFVTQIEPGIALNGKGHFGVASLNYSVLGRIYAEQDDSNRIDHRLLSSAKVTLMPQHIFLDALGTISQELISPNGNLALQNIAATDDKSTVTTLSLSPYAIVPMGENTQAEVRYKYGEVIYEKESATDAQSNEADITFKGSALAKQLLWSLSYQDARVDYENRPVTEVNQTALAGLRYSITGSLSGYGNVGYEDHQGIAWPGEKSPSGKSWKVGMAWNPSEAVMFEVDYGRRFFGATKGMKLSFTTPHSSWTGSYREELSSQQRLQFDRANAALLSNSAGLSASPDSIQFVASTVASIFIRKSATLGYSVKTAKTDTGINLFHERRDFQDNGKEEIVRGINSAWGWAFIERTKLSLGAGWQEATDEPETFHNIVHYYDVTLNRQIRPKMQGAVAVRRNQQHGRISTNSYVENLLTAKLTYLF